MITEQDLKEAIAECQGQRSPTASTCIKLAAYYTILNNLEGNQSHDVFPAYSFASTPTMEIPYTDSKFSQLVINKGIDRAYPVIEELMNTLYVLNPKLYNSVLRKISEI